MKIIRLIICSLLLSITLTLSPKTEAYASEVLHVHPRATFDIPVGSADALNASGDAYLTADITLSSDVVISDTLSLCLNGFDINIGSYSINIEPAGSLNIYECPHNPGGNITVAAGEKPAIEVFGALNVLGGNFSSDGRTIISNRNETTISGGSITGSDAQLVQTSGGALMHIMGGEIVASGTGSAIAMVAAPEDENAFKRDYNAVIGGGLVSAGPESPAALVVNAPKGRFVINSGSNIRGSGCPGIKVEAGSFDAYGGAYVYSDTASAIVGVGGNVNLYFADIISDEAYGVDISGDANLLLSGSLDVVGGNAGIRLAEGKVFSMSDYGFYGDVRISIHTDQIPTEGNPVPISTRCDAKHYSHFLSATPSASITYKDMIIYNSYDGTVAHSHDGRNYVLALNGGYTDLSKNNYYLEEDLSRGGFFTGSVVNICLNGHTLNLSGAIKLYPGSTLNIYDCQGTGKILCNSTCIQDINDGSAKVVIHQGSVVSNSGAPIKLSGDDSVIVKGGQVMSVLDGSCAVEASGLNNSVTVNSGSIEGIAAGIRVQDGTLTVSGKPEGTIKGSCAVHCSGTKEGLLTVDGNVNMDSQTADILLAPGKFLAAGEQLDPSAKFSIVSETTADSVTLSAASASDISAHFVSTDSSKTLVCTEGNVLQLVRALPASPDSAEISYGESAEFKTEYTGAGTPSYQWYIRNTETGITQAADGAVSAVFSTPSDLASGSYELYCVVSDESSTYAGSRLSLTVKKDVIENVSVSSSSQLSYTGETVTPDINASASTALGRSVSFRYSPDGTDYTDTVPSIGPEAGSYTIYYIASAEGCEDIRGQLSVEIKADEQTEPAELPAMSNFSPRLIAIIVSVGIFFVLCIIFAVQMIRKVRED